MGRQEATTVPNLLTTAEAAERLGVSGARFRALVAEGRIPIAWRPGPRAQFFDPAALDKFCEARDLYRGRGLR